MMRAEIRTREVRVCRATGRWFFGQYWTKEGKMSTRHTIICLIVMLLLRCNSAFINLYQLSVLFARRWDDLAMSTMDGNTDQLP